MLITGHFFMGLIHIWLPFNRMFSDAVDHDVSMNISGMIITICMSYDQSLIAGKVFLGIFLT